MVRALSFLLFLGALALLYFQDQIVDSLLSSKPAPIEKTKIGILTQSQGPAILIRGDEDFAAESDVVLLNHDKLETKEGDLTFRLEDGSTIYLYPDSRAIVEYAEQNDGFYLVSILRGDYRLDSTSPQLLISKNGEVTRPAQPRREEPKPVEKPKPKVQPDTKIGRAVVPKNKRPPTQLPGKGQKLSLEQKEIQTVMKRQKFWLDKCYANYLKNNPNASGEIRIVFDIFPNGRVKNAKYMNSTLPDKTLEKCVLQTIRRARFQKFSGSPQKVVFPIHFGSR